MRLSWRRWRRRGDNELVDLRVNQFADGSIDGEVSHKGRRFVFDIPPERSVDAAELLTVLVRELTDDGTERSFEDVLTEFGLTEDDLEEQ